MVKAPDTEIGKTYYHPTDCEDELGPEYVTRIKKMAGHSWVPDSLYFVNQRYQLRALTPYDELYLVEQPEADQLRNELAATQRREAALRSCLQDAQRVYTTDGDYVIVVTGTEKRLVLDYNGEPPEEESE